MNENVESVAVDTLEVELDSAWGEDDAVLEAADMDEAEPEAKEEPAETVEEKPEEPVAEKADQPELFTLKNRDETRQVSKEDLIAMAQKGWDYDAVRTERDQLRQYRAEADPALALVRDYAKRAGFENNIPGYIDFCREQELKASGKTEAEAKSIMAQEKREANLVARERAIAEKESAQTSAEVAAKKAQEARRQDIQNFFRAYPGVDPKTIPAEVWDSVLKKGDTLVNAYTMHENKRLQAELAAERKNKSNHASSPGSLVGTNVTEQDELDRIWAEDD